VELLFAQPVPPGKLLVAVHGGVADVESAVARGLDIAADRLEDALFIPRLHPDVVAAFVQPLESGEVDAIGIVETRTVAAALRAADAALKAARVRLVSLRMGLGIGGKAIWHVTGSVADVEAAVAAGRAAVRVEELFLDSAVLARPHGDLGSYLDGGPGSPQPLPGVRRPGSDGG
jgi:microcompartment protein CcmL/EutN